MSIFTALWWNSPYSRKVFEIRKNRIRKTTGCRSRDSCTNLLKTTQILTLKSLCIFLFFHLQLTTKINSNWTLDVCNINTRQKFNFHQPLSNLSLY